MLQPRVSVLMPCHNASSMVDDAVASILRQTLVDLELVAVDDGSSDDSPRRLADWAKRDNRVRVIWQPHRGIVSALNTGLDACRSPLIARMDADDRAHPERLEAQVALLDEHVDLAVAGCLVTAFPKEHVRQGFRIYLQWLNGLLTAEEIAREIYIESPLPHPSTVIRHSWLTRVGGYQDHGWPEDYDLWLRIHLAGGRFAKVPRTLLEWREHATRITRIDSRYSVENFLRAKAHYLGLGPLREREAVIIWGAGSYGRRLAKHLLRHGAPLALFVDIDAKKIGHKRQGLPITAPLHLPERWRNYRRPVLLVAVRARGARELIRCQLLAMGLVEGADWWAVA